MPIYEYVCHACGFEKEHLQKVNDAPIANCPACNSSEYIKKVSAAGFILKGSGWYVTDFRDKKTTKTDSSAQNEKRTGTDKAGTGSQESASPATANTATVAEG